MSRRVSVPFLEDPMLAFLDAMPDGMVVSDTDGTIVLVNGQLEKLSGYTADELTGRTVETLVPDDQRTRHRAHRNDYHASGLPPRTMGSGLEIFLHRRDGSLLPVDIALGTIRLRGRTLALSAVRDATDRRRAEALVRDNERRWRTLLENVSLVVVGLDLERHITYTNRFFRELCDYTEDELLGQDWFELCLPDEARQDVMETFDHVVADDSADHHVNAIRARDGRQRVIAWNNALLRDSSGLAVGTLSIGEDVTDRRRVEAHVTAMSDVAQAILEDRPVDDVMRIIARHSRALVDASVATVITLTEDKDVLVVQVADGAHAADLEGLRLPATGSISADVLRSREAAAVADASTDARMNQPVVRTASVGPVLVAPLAVTDRAFGTLLVGRPLGARAFGDEEMAVIELFASQAAIALEHTRFQQELHRLAVLEDRERIGRELHDGAIQTLFATGMRLQSTLHLVDGEAAERVDQAIESLDGVIGELRSYIFDLRPGARHRHDVTEALRRLGRELQESAGVVTVVEVNAQVAGTIEPSSDLVQLVHEALSNVGRHANAKKCRVAVSREGARVVVEIADDGDGFRLDHRFGAGQGLTNLYERAAALGAALEIVTTPGGGTTIRAIIAP